MLPDALIVYVRQPYTGHFGEQAGCSPDQTLAGGSGQPGSTAR